MFGQRPKLKSKSATWRDAENALVFAWRRLRRLRRKQASATDVAGAPDLSGPRPDRRQQGHWQPNATQKRILAYCRHKSHKGETIAKHLALTWDYVRHLLGPLVNRGKLRKNADGYRTV
jgi:hypothetical protein